MLFPAVAVLLVLVLAVLVWRRASARGQSARQARGEDVRFSVYRPAAVAPSTWYDLLVFAHRTGRSTDTTVDEPLPAERVRLEAQRLLGAKAKAYESIAEDSSAPVAPGTEIIVIPQMDGVQFQPPQVVMEWRDDVQRAPFQFRADIRLDGTTARGQVSLFSGPLLLAEMALVIRVSAVDAEETARDGVTESVSPYRKVFASYSHRDEAIVRQMETYAVAFGDEYLRDVRSLRAGERWDDRLLKLIDEADVFQLFWSWNALESEYVRREWTYALQLRRKNFVRPVYWQDPLPEVPERQLPSPELRTLHFQRLPTMAPVPSDPLSAAVPSPRASVPNAPVAVAQPRLPGGKRPFMAASSWLRVAVLAGVVLLSVTVVLRQGLLVTGQEQLPSSTPLESPAPGEADAPDSMVGGTPQPDGSSRPPRAPTSQISQVIDRYAASLDRRSMPELKRAFPGVSDREQRWRDLGSDDVEELSAAGVVGSVEDAGGDAQASFRLSLTVKPTGGRPFTVQIQAEALLRFAGGSWTIVRLRERGP